MGKRYPVRAYRFCDEHYTIEELVAWIPKLKEWDEYRIDMTERDTVPKDTAKKLWPDWYEYRINQGKSSKWSVKRDLYDWWKGKIIENATYGHRYFCLMCLAIFAIKCDVPEEELKRDALALVPILDKLSDDADPKSRFTEEDALCALHGYRENFKTWGRDKLALVSAIPMPANKRNYRPQSEHIRIMNAVREVLHPNGSWRNIEGRPSKEEKVKAWRLANPNGKKIECERELGLSRHTVLKWWDN